VDGVSEEAGGGTGARPAAARDMRWWGWGDPAHPSALPEHAVTLLRDEVGVRADPRLPVKLDDVRLPERRLGDAAREPLAAIVGEDGIRDDREARILHAAGKSYPDLVRQRSGQPEDAPDAIVYPSSHDQVAAVLAACAREGVAVVPFGGGTSVVGGVAPLRGRFGSLIALDLRRLDDLHEVDARSLTVRAGAGIRGPALEARLAEHGLTLGHFPQSYEYVSVGGCVATRSAGQASTGYGRIDKLLLGARMAAPVGELALDPRPASAAGPELRQLVAGSEGLLGVITEVALKVAPAPARKRYEGFFFRSFQEGAEALRALVQNHAAPDVARLSDEEETRLSLALAGEGGLKTSVGRRYIAARGYESGCLAICGWEGTEADVRRRRARSVTLLKRHGALALGSSPGRAWAAGRFAGPYFRDDLLERGVMAETLETAAQWSRLADLYAAVAGALRESLAARGTPPLVMCHISHLYESGASLYYTFIARQQEGEEIEQWRAAKVAASDAIAAQRATITHHHAIGRDHVPWIEAEVGAGGIAALRAAKDVFDPEGIMNPGKLLPASGA
jgi:alkyldihydroxyacetonephosphate synthase